ncbi:bifunctional ligase/repressor BirA [bacterium BMS3Abin03]|nr:bifunctional ligase/repressor BirA [bacterium BMS3Abin03]
MEKQFFDLEYFDLKLDTDHIGRHFVYASEVTSTNNFLLDERKKYSQNGTVLLAEFQSEGKGRKQRQWHSQPNANLTFSILLTDPALLSANPNIINLATSLAVAVSIENLYQLRTELKWPNDVLIDSKKVAGILLESVSRGKRIERLVIGIGINVNQTAFQSKFNIEPTSIRNETGQKVDRERLLAEFLNCFEEQLSYVKRSPSNILKSWKLKCRMIGERITITDDDFVKHGIFDDIDNNGFLLLKTDGKDEVMKFGDVSLR